MARWKSIIVHELLFQINSLSQIVKSPNQKAFDLHSIVLLENLLYGGPKVPNLQSSLKFLWKIEFVYTVEPKVGLAFLFNGFI